MQNRSHFVESKKRHWMFLLGFLFGLCGIPASHASSLAHHRLPARSVRGGLVSGSTRNEDNSVASDHESDGIRVERNAPTHVSASAGTLVALHVVLPSELYLSTTRVPVAREYVVPKTSRARTSDRGRAPPVA